MVEDYLLYKNTINNDLKHKLIDSYLEHKSIKKLCKLYPRLSKSEIQRHLITTIRLPDELQELESSLHSNPNLSKIIACFATDHHNWDGQKSKKDKVVSLALSIAKYLDTDKQINLVFQGIKAPDNLPVRPTTDMAKEALFNILENRYYINKKKVLDLFSGTGNIAFEFASRGAENITAVDQHFHCCNFITKTATKLNYTIDVRKMDCFWKI